MDEENESDTFGEDYEDESRSTISLHSEDFISKPSISKDGTVPLDILEFHHSFGYDCRKRFNLCVADPDTLIFSSGNLIHFFNVAKNELTFRRCSTGGGIGHITKNPKFNHIAIGENGVNPPIIIYEWPSMEIVTVLRKGTTRSFSHLRYSPDGEQLVSQGGDPDYLITVWDWQRSKIALQSKSHGQDVYNVVFSATLPGRITSCGAGHIKCWKMALTFTGLKLQGELGRFGKTEISDIVGSYPMPDEKIISGCEWGNILVWNEGLIKIEVCRKNGKPCHTQYISQFEYINGELISIGTDGFIRVWYYETIDLAEPTEESNLIEVEPINELVIGDQVNGKDSSRRSMLLQILRQDPNDPDNNHWYAQDGNGGIWLIELVTLQTPKPSQRLLRCHAGPILDLDGADWAPYIATIGVDGCLHIYHYYLKKLVFFHQFQDEGRCVVWLPCSVEPSGSTIICAFSNGVVRMVWVDLRANKKRSSKAPISLKLMQVLKPHTKKITFMETNPTYSLLVTGSDDSTLFVFQIQAKESYPHLVPIGYVEVPSRVTFITWKPGHSATIFMGCLRGHCVEVDLPEEPQSYTTISYKLTKCKPIIFQFESVKSAILREEFRVELDRMRMQKIAEKREELNQLKENNPGIEVDEALFIEAALEEEPPLPEIYIPEVPNRVLAAFYTTRDTIVLSVGGYDAGFIYEYSAPDHHKKSVNIASTKLADYDDEVSYFLFYNDRKYAIMGMGHGEIRVCRVNPEVDADFSNYWVLSMHDNFYGHISKMYLSHDQKVLITCGYDGNIFSFLINDDVPPKEVRAPEVNPDAEIPETEVIDIEDTDYLSLEQVIVKKEMNRIMANAKEEKEKTLAILHQLTDEYNVILRRNSNLPQSQMLTEEELELDPRISTDLDFQLQAEMDLVYKKLAYNVEKSQIKLDKLMKHFIEPLTSLPFAVKRILRPDTMVYSLREKKLTGDYRIDRKERRSSDILADDEDSTTTTNREDDKKSYSIAESERTAPESEYDDSGPGEEKLRGVESFLKGLSPRTIQCKLGDEINQMLKKYRALKAKLEEQEQEWKVLQSEKPDRKVIHPEDVDEIETAKSTIGDYKLKASLGVENNTYHPTVVSKYKEIIDCRRKIHFRREDFNEKLRELRKKKSDLQNEVTTLIRSLKQIHSEIPEQFVRPLPMVPVFDDEVEFPEKQLKMESYTSIPDRVRESKRKKVPHIEEQFLENFDEEYEVLLLDERRFRRAVSMNEAKVKLPETRSIRCTVASDVLAAIEESEKVESKLEREMKRVRVARKNHEQGEILEYIRNSYEAFDAELDQLEKERLEIIHESVYMDLYLLTMHQELIVLKRFEGMENELTKKVNQRLKAMKTVKNKIQKLTARIEDRNSRILKLQEKIKESMTRYLNSIMEDKFLIFLKRVVKKKYKPPKADDASTSSSDSSSSDSSSDDDDADDDSETEDQTKLAMMHMDEGICPEGCDRDLYDEAFAVREKRYDMERRCRDDQRAIETLAKELDDQRKELKGIEAELQSDRDRLDTCLREKQRQLNDIDVTLILKLNQLQCFIDDKTEKIQECVVFDKTRLTQLYARVGELQKETAVQLEKHKNDKIHLRKMKSDCELMKKELEQLKEEIKKEMEQKFGQQVSLLTLYEAVLRRLIFKIKSNTSALIEYYDEKIQNVKFEYKNQLKALKNLIQDNTEKLGFLTVLEEELLKLQKCLNRKMLPEEEIAKVEGQYEADLNKFKNILKNQERQKESISKEILNLSNKSKNVERADQSKSDKMKRRPPMTFFEGPEDAKDRLSKTETLISSDTKYMMDDSDFYKKVIAIRHLLSQVATVDEMNTRATIEKMLREITQNMKEAGYCKEDIEKNLSDIMRISYEGTDLSQDWSKDTVDSLSDMIYKYSLELKESTVLHEAELNPVLQEGLEVLFESLGIKDDDGHVAQGVLSRLLASEDTRSALNFVLERLPAETDEETRLALCKHAEQCLSQIMEHARAEGAEPHDAGSKQFHT